MNFLARYMVTIYLVKIDKCVPLPDTSDVSFFSRETITDLGQQVSLNWKQLTMNIWGRWALQILTLMASYIGPEAMATQAVMNSVSNLARMVPIGFAKTCGTLVGNAVGARHEAQAKSYYHILISINATICIVTCICLQLFKDTVIHRFTQVPEIVSGMSVVWPVLLGMISSKTMENLLSSAIRGTGQ